MPLPNFSLSLSRILLSKDIHQFVSSAAVVLGLAPRAVKNAGSAFALDSSTIAVVESVSAVSEVNAWGLVSSV